MILTVCLNPCLDRILFVPELKVNTLNRSQKSLVSAGGKGVNVAKVISALDEPVCITGFFAGNAGKLIVEELEKRNVITKPVWISGQETRTTTNILDLSSGKETEITESGPEIGPRHMEDLLAEYENLLSFSDPVVLSGSVPLGVPEDIYARLIQIAKKHGKKTVLDTAGNLLARGILECPFIIKPNIRELNALTAGESSSHEQIAKQCDLLHRRGISHVCVSMGKDGALLSCKEGLFFQPAFPVKTVNTIGSGDSMVAGLAVSIKREYAPSEMLGFASACAASNATFQEIGVIDPDQVTRLFSTVDTGHRASYHV